MNAEPIPIYDYLLGFIFSLVLTLGSYFIASENLLYGENLLFALGGLAALQAIVQLYFFFHITEESSPKWQLFSFLFMLLIAVIVIAGTIWIMYNLDYRMMPKM